MKKKLLVEGINEDISNADYHGDKRYLSSSSLKDLLKGPDYYYKTHIGGERPAVSKSTQKVFDEGSYAHTLILEPHLKDVEYAFFPGMRKAGEEYENFVLENSDKVILSKPQKMRVEAWVRAYEKRPEAVNLITGGMAEHTVAGKLNGVPIKVRADYINLDKGYVADVKTCGMGTDIDTFRYVIDQRSYQLSASLYCQMFEQYYGRPFDFYFIVLGKKDLMCQVYRASEATMEEGKMLVYKALSLYKRCKEADSWEPINNLITPVNNSDYEILDI